jgi:hypothetical protein
VFGRHALSFNHPEGGERGVMGEARGRFASTMFLINFVLPFDNK